MKQPKSLLYCQDCKAESETHRSFCAYSMTAIRWQQALTRHFVRCGQNIHVLFVTC